MNRIVQFTKCARLGLLAVFQQRAKFLPFFRGKRDGGALKIRGIRDAGVSVIVYRDLRLPARQDP